MSERETDEPPSQELVTLETFKEKLAAASTPALLIFARNLFRDRFLAEKENFVALEKRIKCLQETVASTDAEIAAWVDEYTSSIEDLEYWDSKMTSLTEGQENMKHESVTIDLLEGLIASTKERLPALCETRASLMEKQASFREAKEELKCEISRAKARFAALKLASEKVYRLEDKLIEALKPKASDAQEPSITGHH